MLRSRLAALLLLGAVGCGGALVGCGDATPTAGDRTPAPTPTGFALGHELTTAAGTRYTSTDLSLPGGRALVMAPATVPLGSPAVLVVVLHGAGGSEQTINGFEMGATRDALLDRGWLVASAMAYDRGWGNEASLRDYRALADLVGEHWAVTDVLLHGQSMGAVPAVLLLAERRIPDIRAVALVAPALSLEAVYERGFADDLEKAYGFRGSDELADAVAGHDPMRLDPAALAGGRIRVWASPSDNLTPKAVHADPFARRMGPVVEVVEVEGDHFGPDHHRPAELVAFYEKALTGSSSPAPARVLLALRDNGSTVVVSRTTRITLSLPSSYRWSEPVFEGARATASEVVSDAPAGGQVFEVIAHETGRSTLRSTGRPACAVGPSCPPTDLSYEVVLDVRS